jgi:hypothetical protein
MKRMGRANIEGKAAREAVPEAGAKRVSTFFGSEFVISVISVVKA